MKANSDECKGFIKSDSGGIDYSYYEERARKIRSDCFMEIFSLLFRNEKESTKKLSVNCKESNQMAICH